MIPKTLHLQISDCWFYGLFDFWVCGDFKSRIYGPLDVSGQECCILGFWGWALVFKLFFPSHLPVGSCLVIWKPRLEIGSTTCSLGFRVTRVHSGYVRIQRSKVSKHAGCNIIPQTR